MRLLFLLACILPIQEEQASNQTDRLSPAPLKRRATYKTEAPVFLDDQYIVESPEEVLENLRSIQQKAWDEVKSVKGRAWYNWIRRDPNKRGTVGLMVFSILQNPKKKKCFMYYQKKAYEDYKNGTVTDVGGADPDAKEAYYCTTATIHTPEMAVLATGYLRQGLDDIEVNNPDYQDGELLNFQRSRFQYKSSPNEFFETRIPYLKKRKYQVQVKAKDEFVEISVLFPKPKKKPAYRWLFDLSKDGAAVYSYQVGLVQESEFQKVQNHWLPKFRVKKTHDQYSETRFFDLAINSEFAADEFTVKSLPVRDDKVRVRHIHPGKSVPFKDYKK